METAQHVLFIDLHGVLVQTPVIFERYKEITVDHLIDNFNLSREEATTRYEQSMKKWEKEAFSYLRDPRTKKVGVQFLEFLDECDALFPSLLYEGLDGMGSCQDVRSRPFEFSVASQVRALYPEVKETLNRLKDLNYRMYVASSSHSSHILGILEANDIGDYFDKVFGFDTLAATKHTLKYYKEMLNVAKVRPKASVMIGNSMHEVLKPRRLGMLTIHINRERKVPMDVRRKADFSITDISSLPSRLDVI